MFQFTLPRGERQTLGARNDADLEFQFTLPRGERRFCIFSRAKAARFNSRSREGSDIRSARVLISPSDVSIHAPARGATAVDETLNADSTFQFTLPRGERRLCDERYHVATRFNSRSREGSDSSLLDEPRRPVGFQFTLPRGERRGSRYAPRSR